VFWVSDSKSFKERFADAQAEIKAKKNQWNKFGKFWYRNAEDILEAAKPVLKKHRLYLTITDNIVQVGERFYVHATVTINDMDSDDVIVTSAYAREPDRKTGMDEPQITGTASTYARKYAMNGLFCLDDQKDADTDEYQEQTRQPQQGRQQGGQRQQPQNHGGGYQQNQQPPQNQGYRKGYRQPQNQPPQQNYQPQQQPPQNYQPRQQQQRIQSPDYQQMPIPDHPTALQVDSLLKLARSKGLGLQYIQKAAGVARAEDMSMYDYSRIAGDLQKLPDVKQSNLNL